MSNPIKYKTTKAKPGIQDLYHISFKNHTFQGMWHPDNPAGFEEEQESAPGVVGDQSFPYPEPSLPRISVGPTIDQCFRGVFPNVAKLFEEKNYPYMEYNVFQPKFKGTERLILPKELTSQRIVWDACVTEEHCILDSVWMQHTGKVRIFNTNASPTMFIHPFGDPKNPVESVGPAVIRYEWVNRKRSDRT